MYKKEICPKCGKEELVKIVYGFPAPELFELADKGLVKLGGCCVPIDFRSNRNNYYCNNCDEEIEVYPHDIIFEYKVNSAWGEPIFRLTITKENDFNVEFSSFDEKSIEGIGTISNEQLNELLEKYIDLFEIKDIPMSPVLDGVENNFYFKYKRKKKRLTTFNIDYYYGQDDIPNEAKIVIDFLIELFNLLRKNNIKENLMYYLLFNEEN